MDLLLNGLGDLVSKKSWKYLVPSLSWSLLARFLCRPPMPLRLVAEFEGDVVLAVGEGGVRSS